MGALLLSFYVTAQQGESMLVKRYGKKYGDGGMLFNAFICFFAVIFFLITDKNGLCFPKELLPYGIFSCVMFATGFYTMYLALQIGSYAGTTMFSSFSGIFPIIYGIFFLKEPSGFTTIAAIALIFISVYLRVSQKSINNEKSSSVPLRWYVYVLLSAVSNGFIAIISRTQQLYFHNAYDNEFMIISFTGSAIFLFAVSLMKEKENFKKVGKYGLFYGMATGLLNGLKNFLNLMIYLYIPISVTVPLEQGLCFLASFIISKLLYKESHTKRELLAFLVGGIAIILFNI